MLFQCQYSVYNQQSDVTPVSVFCVLPTKWCYSSVSILCITDNMVLLQCHYSVYNWQHDVTPVSVFCVLPTKWCYSSVSIMCITDNMMLLQCQYSVYDQQSDVNNGLFFLFFLSAISPESS